MSLSARYDLKHFEAFLHVAEEKHFGNAARKAYVSAPTMSARIKDFESALGYDLFERTSRSVELTSRGEVLLRGLSAAVDDLRAILLETDHRDASSTDLSVAVVSDTDRTAVLAGINRLRTVYRTVRTERVSDNLVADLLETNAVQLAVSWSNATDLGLDPELYESRSLVAQPTYVIVKATDHLAQAESVSLDDFADRPIVLFHRDIAPTPYDIIMGFLRSNGGEPELVAPQHSQSSMADSLEWTDGAITVGSEANIALLPDRFVAVPIEPQLLTSVQAHAKLEHSALVDKLSEFVAEY